MIGGTRSWRVLVVLVAGVAGALVVSGCGGAVQSLSFPTPPPTAAAAVVAPPADYSGVSQLPVSGATTTTVPAIGPGGATIDGTIIGPSGPVVGATVEADRLVNGVSATTQATTAGDGSFTIARILGGIYRVRAWQAPMLSVPTPDVFFLGGTQTQAVNLTLQPYAGVQVSSSMAPNPVVVGGDANLVVSVTQQTVGTDGVVRPIPLSAQSVTIESGGGWVTTTLNPATTDGNGHATFVLVCTSAAAPSLVALVTGAPPATLTTSACINPALAAPTTTTTTTTVPGGTGANTSTTIGSNQPTG